jgi:hypothetical protein
MSFGKPTYCLPLILQTIQNLADLDSLIKVTYQQDAYYINFSGVVSKTFIFSQIQSNKATPFSAGYADLLVTKRWLNTCALATPLRLL